MVALLLSLKSTMIHALFLLFIWGKLVAALDVITGNTTCKGPDLDWYRVGTGETPCRTYERLRQQCDGNYLVGNFTQSLPGDKCNDANSQCCCNSVAFYLSMLCYNCQTDLHSPHGSDAPTPGTYQTYLDQCPTVSNQSLPLAIQVESCNNGIKIYDSLYTLYWPDGTFFYEFTKQAIVNQYTQNGVDASFSHCENIPTPSGGIVTATTASSTPTPSGNTTNTAFPRSQIAFVSVAMSLMGVMASWMMA